MITNRIYDITARKTPFTAVRFAFSKFFSPNDLDKIAFTPTPVPVAVAIIKLWIGKASDTAVKAFSLIFATKILSTILYKACTSMDIIIGSDIDSKSLFTGITPILFSFCISILSSFSALHFAHV